VLEVLTSMKSVIVSLFFLLIIPATAFPMSQTDRVSITVTRMAKEDSWRVEYNFKTPVHGFVFSRARNLFRTGNWKVLEEKSDDGFAIDHLGHREAIIHTTKEVPGKRLRRFSFSFPSDFSRKPKDYELNLSFLDGGRLLYTGHFQGSVLVCPDHHKTCPRDDLIPSDSEIDVTYIFRSASDERIVLLDREIRKKLVWRPRDKFPDGTYVYFGKTKPHRHGSFSMIVDRKLPAWLYSSTVKLIPKLFEYYQGRFGISLDFKPLIMLSYSEPESPGAGAGGGVLPGQIQLAANGKPWQEPSDKLSEKWFGFIAHETSHLWNTRMFSTFLGSHEEWLTEGSAEYFKHLSLLNLGIIDQSRFNEVLSDTVNQCLLVRRGGPLLTSHQTGRYEAFYNCGEIIMFMLDKDVRHQTGDEKTIFNLFASVFAKASKTDGKYSTYDLLEAYEGIVKDPLRAYAIEELLRGDVSEGAVEFFHQALVAKHIPASLVPLHQAFYDKSKYRRMLGIVLGRCDCAGRHAPPIPYPSHARLPGISTTRYEKENPSLARKPPDAKLSCGVPPISYRLPS
jgi:hypothetical protein